MPSWTSVNGRREWPLHLGWRSRDEILLDLRQRGIDLNAYAALLFTRKTLWDPGGLVELTVRAVSVRDLGLPDGATYDAILAALPQHNLAPCPILTAATLRLVYTDQPMGEQLTVVSEPLFDDPRYPDGLYLRRDERGTWLRGYRASADWIWPADGLLIVVSE